MGAGALAVGAGGFLAACSSGLKGAGGSSSSGTINIGFITPLTGSLAGFASGDTFVLDQVKATSAYKNGFKVGGKTFKVLVEQDVSQAPRAASRVHCLLEGRTTLTGRPADLTAARIESAYFGLGKAASGPAGAAE